MCEEAVEKSAVAVWVGRISATLVSSEPVSVCTCLTSLIDTVNGNSYGSGTVATTCVGHRVCETVGG